MIFELVDRGTLGVPLPTKQTRLYSCSLPFCFCCQWSARRFADNRTKSTLFTSQGSCNLFSTRCLASLDCLTNTERLVVKLFSGRLDTKRQDNKRYRADDQYVKLFLSRLDAERQDNKRSHADAQYVKHFLDRLDAGKQDEAIKLKRKRGGNNGSGSFLCFYSNKSIFHLDLTSYPASWAKRWTEDQEKLSKQRPDGIK